MLNVHSTGLPILASARVFSRTRRTTKRTMKRRKRDTGTQENSKAQHESTQEKIHRRTYKLERKQTTNGRHERNSECRARA